jgi:acyl carrier protein
MSSQTEIFERIKRCIIERLELNMNLAHFTDDMPLFAPLQAGGMDLDSLASIEIVVGLSKEFQLQLDDVPREAFQSVRTLGMFIAGQLPPVVVPKPELA